MELRRKRGVATILVFPIKDASGNVVTGITGVTPQISVWAGDTTVAPGAFANILGGLTEVGTTGIYYSSLTDAEAASDFIYFIASPNSGTGKRQDLLINCTAVASVTQVATTTDLGTAAANVVNAQVVDVIRVDTATELTGVPAASPALMTMMQWNYMAARNLRETRSTFDRVTNDAGVTIATATIGDDGTTFNRNEYA